MGRSRGVVLRRLRVFVAVAASMALVGGLVPGGVAELLNGVQNDAAAAPGVTPPQQGTPEEINGRQAGEPGAAVDLVEKPATDSYGAAGTVHPLEIPTGRIDWQPDVSLAYSSEGGNGWVGTGWDVSVDSIKIPALDTEVPADAIAVDTRWGVPRFEDQHETETYTFGGEQLSPVAHHQLHPEDRKAERIFHKRVEGDFLRIVRHGNAPENYWWEVHDKLGNKYFYGGVLDEPPHDIFDDDGNQIGTFDGLGHQDPEAVLFDRDDNAYWWGLKEKWDISTNVVTYYYDKRDGDDGDTGVGSGDQSGAPRGTEMYLKRINYTGYRLRPSAIDGQALPRFGPYDIVFDRDSELGEDRRPDVSMRGTNGALEVTADLLRHIDVWYTPQPADPPIENGDGDLAPPLVPREGTQLVRRYNLKYTTGPFNKSLLSTVEKMDKNGNVLSTNSFEYYDEIPRKDGQYDVFGPEETWHTGSDDMFKEFLGVESGSALGGAESLGGDGRLFLGIGFGGKVISAGGGLQLGGSDGQSLLEFIDITGDNLPDKVFKKGNCDGNGARVCYRANTSGASAPLGEATFSEPRPIVGLDHLSESKDIFVGGGAEAYGGPASVMFNMNFAFSLQESYFSDVNADGYVDLVRDGDVLFNINGENDNKIVFDEDSGPTSFPLDQTETLDPSLVPEVNKDADMQEGLFPRIDTVRRWIAPFAGTVKIEAPVALAEPAKSEDGVRVAIQYDGFELWSADIPGGDGETRTPTGLDAVPVQRGDRIYFRVQSKSNGMKDIVDWDPKITYVGAPLDQVDVNGARKFVYEASKDFTLSGYKGTFVGMPLGGRIKIDGDVVKTKTTSDDAEIRIFRNDELVYCNKIAHDEVGTFILDEPATQDCDPSQNPAPANVHEFDVQGTRPDPTNPGEELTGDRVKAEIFTDTNIDPNAIVWKPHLSYVEARDAMGNALPVTDENGRNVMSIDLPATVAIFPNTDSPMPQEDDSPEEDGQNVGVHITATSELEDIKDEFGQPVLPTDVVFSIKTRDGRPAFKTTFTIPRLHDENGDHLGEVSDNGHCTGTWSGPQDPHIFSLSPDPLIGCSIDWGAVDDEDYYYDFTFQDPGVQRFVSTWVTGSGTHSARWWGGPITFGDDVDVFPPAYRGWGYVGYNGDGERASQPINEADLVLKKDELPSCEDPDDNGCEDQPSGFPEDTPEGTGSDDPNFKNPVNGKYYIYVPAPERGYWRGPKDVDTEGLTAEEIERLGDLVNGATWGGPGQASSTLTAGDEELGPTKAEIIAPGADAPTIYGEANARSLGGGFGGFGGGAGWGESRGMVDYLDLNGDAFPDVVGTGCLGCPDDTEGVLYTNQLGVGKYNIDHGWGDVRENHEFVDQAGGGGSPAAPKSKANGDGNTVKQAGGSSSPTGRKGKGGGATKKAGTKAGSKKTGTNPLSKKGIFKSAGKGAAAKVGRVIGRAIPYLPTIGLSGTIGKQETNSGNQLPEHGDEVQNDLADLNGDGLPDRVTVFKDGTMKVRWNLGYAFSGEAEWPNGQSLEEAGSGSESLDVGIGFSAGIFEFSGGVQVSRESESTHVTWTDVNGDGLDDRVSADIGDFVRQDSTNVTVELNTGTGLASGIPFGSFIEDHISMGESTSLGGGADFTIAIPLPYCLGICQFIVNPGFHVTKGHTSPRIELVDVDGDGYVDSVSSGRDSELKVRRSRIGRTNLLKKITNALGATYTLSYERNGNTQANPEGVWTLSRIETFDGHADDGVDEQVTTYRFEDGNLSYSEREHYGYAKVLHEDRDPTTGNVYRSWETTYDNSNYYARGLLLKEVMRDGEGRPVQTTENTYRLVDSQDPSAPVDPESFGATIFPQLLSEETLWHDDTGAVARSERIDYEYDVRGNVTKTKDLGDSGTSADDVVAEVDFHNGDDGGYCDAHKEFPWTQVADSLLVTSGSKVLQRRDATVFCDYAAVTQVRDYLDPATTDVADEQQDAWCEDPIGTHPGDDAVVNPKIAVTEVCYHAIGGQLSRVIGPSNANGQRYVVDLSYDDPDRHGSFVTKTTDSYGLATSTTYDNRLGVLAERVDPTGAKTTYERDPAGRLVGIIGPLEQRPVGQPKVYTLKYDYHLEAPDPYVKASHFDATDPNDPIDVLTFVDGLGRTIQTKQDASLFVGAGSAAADRRTVSGQIWYDGLGRVQREFYPVDEPLSAPEGSFNTSANASAPPTETTYDVLDRVRLLKQPGPRITRTDYTFEDPGVGFPVLVKTVEGPGPAVTRSFLDTRQNILGIERQHQTAAGPAPLTTRYEYDALKRLTKVIAPGNRTTTAAYDLLGRRLRVDNPDTGLVELTYDLASNITTKTTPNLRLTGRRISYDYDITRLTGVRYPNNPMNNVTYTYGPATPRSTSSGRITKIVDGARTQSLAYDKVGHVTSETSVMKSQYLIYGPALHTYTTEYTYDSWDRPLTMTYPDGEVLSYGYDTGGLANTAKGTKAGATYQYVKRLEYDAFGNRRFVAYGNGETIERSYDPLTVWLTDQDVKGASKVLSHLKYAYDDAGNVIERRDTVPMPLLGAGGQSVQEFTYDDLYRLTSASGSFISSTTGPRSYTLDMTYDATGRLTRKKLTDGPNFLVPTNYDIAYQYNGTKPNTPTHIGDRTYLWDPDGNLLMWQKDGTGTRRVMVWDEEDRVMTAADLGSTASVYKYDHNDDLAIKRDQYGEVSFVNEGYTSYFGGRKWKNVVVGGVAAAVKRVEPQGFEPVQYYFTPDLLSSQYLVTGGGGSTYEHAVFTPTGELWINQLGSELRERDLFAGGRYDRARNLHMMGARLYDPREAHFYAPDPIVVGEFDRSIEEPRVLDPYTYSYNNPETYFDETGEYGIAARDVLRTAALQGAKGAAATAHRWLRADTDYNDAVSKLDRDDHRGRFLAFVGTERESKLQAAIPDLEVFIQIEVEVDKKGNIMGIGEAKINTLKSIYKFFKKHNFRRLRK